MRVLVTGGAGYIGSIVTSALLQAGFQVAVVDNLSTGHREAVDPESLLVGDYGDPAFVDWVCAHYPPDAAVHLAASCVVDESARRPREYFENNVAKLSRFLEVLRRRRVHKILFSSSAAVYGIPSRIPVDEDCPPAPISVYGETKLAGEQLLQNARDSWGCQSIVFRLFNVCGASPDGRLGECHYPETHAFPNLVAAGLGLRAAFYLTGTRHLTPDGTAIRDYVSALDVADAVLLGLRALDAGLSGPFNVGTASGLTVRQLISSVESVLRRPLPVKELPLREGDPPQLVANVQKIKETLGWKPRQTLNDTIRSVVRWFESHPGGYAS